jgi:hypothetical protein
MAPPAVMGSAGSLDRRIIGIDGEGLGRGPHRYVYLAACEAPTAASLTAETPARAPQAWDVTARKGRRLTTVQALDMILSLPDRALIVGFAFAGYDVTKILTDLPDAALWSLMHPDTRRRVIDGKEICVSVKWGAYRLNLQNRTLTVRKGPRRRSVHDVFKFFQCSFVKALTDWGVATDAELAHMRGMKDRRARFSDRQLPTIAAYCRQECVYLARLFRKLLDAHAQAGIALGRYDGPGSSAKVLLRKMGVLKHRGEIPAAMDHAVSCAYFGGRFEHARAGAVAGKIYSYDLASAYPYAATALPCLAHGRWRLVERPTARQLDGAAAACVRWTGGATHDAPWGALPVRSDEGTIVFPLAGAGGWAWGNEFRAAQRYGNFRAVAAWLLDGCDCPPPFAALADTYRARVQLGKDGAGRAFKMASNSCYGVLCQSVGKAPFRCLVWAGMITSDTRAELLRMMLPDPASVIMLATDGLYARHRLPMRAPRDTGTGDLPVPLGAWEQKTASADGVFLVRPGIYFPTGAQTADHVKARGITKPSLLAALPRLIAAHRAGAGSYVVKGMQRFCGAKSSLHRREIEPITRDGYTFKRWEVSRAAEFGEWRPMPVDLHFSPLPKRTRAVRGRLLPWLRTAWDSFPYSKGVKSPDAVALDKLDDLLEEQPDSEFTDEGG